MKVLVTGFEPFNKETINPAALALKDLPDTIGGASVITRQLPTVFHKSIEVLLDTLDSENPDITICVGQAGGRPDITVERVAININDSSIPDNENNQPIDEPIFADGPAAYFSNLPIKAMVREIRQEKIPASISNSAGTFVCNHIMYGLLYNIERKFPHMRGGFIHVPYVPEQVIDKPQKPSMSLADISRGLIAAVRVAVRNQTDIKGVGGKVWT